MRQGQKIIESHKDSVKIQIIFFYLFFIDGLVYSMGSIMPYVYPQLPPYSLMSLFYAAFYPWCLKFLIAPFLEKYTSFDYGKRKTWISLSSIIIGGLLIFSSFYTSLQDATIFACLLIVINTFVVIHSFSIESMGIKQWKDKDKLAVINVVADYSGMGFGKLFFLKMVNFQFAQKLGLDQPITSASTIVRMYAILVLLSAIIIHFLIKQRRIASQDRASQKDIWKIISYNKTFFDISSKYCRIALMLIIYNQGFNVLNAGYEYNLIEKGYSRNSYNTYQNIIGILGLAVSFYFEEFKFVKISFWLNCLMGITVFKMIIIYQFFPTQDWQIIVLLIMDMEYNWRKIIINQIIYRFPLYGISGMLITGLSSLAWLGESYSLHSILINYLSYFPCLAFAIAFQTIILFVIPSLIDWIQKGTEELDPQLLEKEQYLELQDGQ